MFSSQVRSATWIGEPKLFTIDPIAFRQPRCLPDPNQPTVVALAIETEQGHSLFLATRQILEDLGKDLLERAAKMPPKQGQS